jgi:hypothetical protein
VGTPPSGYNVDVRIVVACALVAGCGSSPKAPASAEPPLGTSHAQPQLVSRHPAPWSRDRIDQELRSDPRSALRELTRGPFVFSDIDAGTDQVVCAAKAGEAIDRVVAILATAPIVTCSKDPPEATTAAIVCLRAQPSSPVVIATFTRASDWVLSGLQVGQTFDADKIKRSAVSAQQMIAKGLVCP